MSEPGVRTTEAAEPRRPGYVQSLDRGLAVIRAFDADHPRLTLTEVAGRAGLTRAAAWRFLHTLVDLGYVAVEGRVFSLRPRVLELGYAYLSSMSLAEIARVHLERLASLVDESSSMSVLDGTDIVYVVRVPARRIMSVDLGVGARLPAFATSMGRVLLAALPDDALEEHVGDLEPLTRRTTTDLAALRQELAVVRRQGWALVDGELEEGLRSVAAPVTDRSGRVVAAVNISTAASRGSVASVTEDLLPHLLRAAREISADLAQRQ
ncbi:IclR family transcriptional regulator C-terminal domain-containing protein [Georgenia sp. AZ-5]|uniref:IclR family transcriptional regulator domain-containing protein n=1 Tax=Georgenia sp. AZ-5 TaxID=3367526 RepID=UPI0037548157